METETVKRDGIQIIIPMSSEDEPHYFGLVDEHGEIIMEHPFCTHEYAARCAGREFPDRNYTVKDMTREWYIDLAVQYTGYLKKLKPSFRKSGIVMDMSGMYYSRNPNSWGTYIPFEYRGRRYVYAETAGEDFVYEVL